MGWFTHQSSSGIPELWGLKPMLPYAFEKGHSYVQIDLDSRDAVEGVADYFMETCRDLGFFATKAVLEIEHGNAKQPGRFAVYAGPDDGGRPIAFVYEKVD